MVAGSGRSRALLGRIPGVRRLHARLVPGAVILLYHRVADDPGDPYALCVGPGRFEEHLDALRRIAHPIALGDLARGLREGRLPKRAVCVTFDDGYQDNLYVAKPILERCEVPATVFMTTGRIGRDREFWWDELARILLLSERLPERLPPELCGEPLDRGLGGSARLGTETARAGWNLGVEDDPTPRHAAFRAIYHILQRKRAPEQMEALDRLSEWSGESTTPRASHRALEPDEVRELDRGGLVDVASHTVNHPDLTSRPREAQREEMTASRATLEDWLERPVRSFSYPYGRYSADSVAEAKRAGYEYACACIGQPARRGSPLLELPRVDAPDVDGDTLARELSAAVGW